MPLGIARVERYSGDWKNLALMCHGGLCVSKWEGARQEEGSCMGDTPPDMTTLLNIVYSSTTW